ncbi:ATPase domain-containing protein [Massilia sp. Leaf139]|uniref:ATPase domain-containing protein n=1 Tax=Massilia sp. Leaf139 TaxID=1736272 RepID=UPI000700AEB3|nr:ATPase domain-containing protein [Massilia sp. Leaf139]KQQ87789.1 protein kinase [Massilia sp. Leaf139]
MTDKVELRLLASGVPGLDTVLGGGLPELSFNIIGGAPGSGKTTFAQQLMFGMAGSGRKALFFTAMGEPPVKMLRYQQQFDFFDVAKIGNEVNFISLAASVEQGDYDIVLAEILEAVRLHAPALVFFDSFRSFIQGARGDQQEAAALQVFVQRLVTHMTSWNATSFLIGEYLAGEASENPIFTVADGIFWLTQHVQRNAMSRKIEVVKMRGQKQRSGLHAFRIDRGGVQVFPRIMPPASPDCPPPPGRSKRLSSGVPVLDEMLGGGIPSGYTALLVGPAGSGKSILSVEFLAAGARNGEAGVIALFERTPNQIMNAKLQTLVDADQVGIVTVRSLDLAVDEILYELMAEIDARKATRLVLDSLTGFEMALSPEHRDDFRESLYRMATVLNARGVTVFLTSELEDSFSELRFSPYGSANLVDVVIMQRYIEWQAELHTVISVVKMRGSKHSRQIRLFQITDDGIDIGSAGAPFEGMLTGQVQLRSS